MPIRYEEKREVTQNAIDILMKIIWKSRIDPNYFHKGSTDVYTWYGEKFCFSLNLPNCENLISKNMRKNSIHVYIRSKFNLFTFDYDFDIFNLEFLEKFPSTYLLISVHSNVDHDFTFPIQIVTLISAFKSPIEYKHKLEQPYWFVRLWNFLNSPI
uniref:Uncharacterized protein n=1 Tax=Pithovirus LCPAC403 TaxID=2506596 RepID=A0A481ZBN6_9VIRU|nr:MAG: hypothetical protein LCPAC403_00190 [Pithovirus LCPAC403]